VKWAEVENCLKKGDPNLLVFDSDEVVARAKKHGDLFEPVLSMKQKIAPLAALQELESGVAATSVAKPRHTEKSSSRTTAKTKRTSAKKSAPARKRG
jgi:bifunctional non-homologous end joining protein LigD